MFWLRWALLVFLGFCILGIFACSREPRSESAPSGFFPPSETHRSLVQEANWLNTSRALQAEDLAGRIILVDFWTFCCINCMHVVPDLQKLENEFGHDLAVIGVHSAKFDNEKETENIRSAVLRYGIEHPVVNDANFKIWNDFGVRAWPTLVLLDPEGKVYRRYSGEGHLRELREDIGQLQKKFAGRFQATALPIALERDKASRAELSFPGKLAYAPELDLLFISDSGHHRILGAKPDGTVVLQIGKKAEAGARDGSFAEARFRQPQGLLYRGGQLYVADTGNHQLRQVDLEKKQVVTLAGTGTQGFERNPHDAAAPNVPLSSPWDLAFFPSSQEIAIAMAGTHQIWGYDLSKKTLRVLAGDGRESIEDGLAARSSLSQPSGLSSFDGRLYFVDSETSSLRVLQDGEVTTLLGSGLFDFGFKDGKRTEALLQHPLGVFADDSGVYIADSYNHALRRYDPSSARLETIAGRGKAGVDLAEPNDVEKAGGKLFIADTNRHRILSLDASQGKAVEWELKFPASENPSKLAAHLPNLKSLPRGKVKAGVEIPLHLDLEAGWKINAQAPSELRLLEVTGGAVVLKASFDKEKIAGKILPLPPLLSGSVYRLQGTLYFCREGAEALCYLQSADQELSADREGLSSLGISLRAAP